MKVLVCSFLVLVALLVLAKGDEEQDHISALYLSFISRITLWKCAGKEDLCSANANSCYEVFIGTRPKLATEEDFARMNEKIIKCGDSLSAGVALSPPSLESFQKLRTGQIGDVMALLFYSGVPESQLSDMYVCVIAETVKMMDQCMTSPNIA